MCKILLIFSLFVLTVPALAEEAGQGLSLKICYEDTPQPPYYYGRGSTPPDENPGLYVEMMTEVAKEVGVTVQYQRGPWKRCLFWLESGNVDAVMASSYSKKRAEIGVFPMRDGMVNEDMRIARKAYMVYYGAAGSALWNGKRFQDPDAPVGMILGYGIKGKLDSLGAANILEVASIEQGLEMLHRNRIAAFVNLEEGTDSFLRKRGDLPISKHAEPIQAKNYYLIFNHAFHAANQDTTERVWWALATIHQRRK